MSKQPKRKLIATSSADEPIVKKDKAGEKDEEEMEEMEEMKEKEEEKEETYKRMVEHFKQCKTNTFHFDKERSFLRPDDYLMEELLRSDVSDKIKIGYRSATSLTEKLDKAFGLVNNINEVEIETLAKEAKAYLHEALFLIRLKQYSNEKAEEIQSAYNVAWRKIEKKDLEELNSLQKKRNDFLDELPLKTGWEQRMREKAYSEGMILNCLLLTDKDDEQIQIKKFGDEDYLKKVTDMILQFEKNKEDFGADWKSEIYDAKGVIKAYAFLIHALNKQQRIDIQFVRKIYEIANSTEGGIIKKKKVEMELETFLNWVDMHFRRGTVDPITLGTIASYQLGSLQPFVNGNHRTGRILMDYILMKRGYPPASMFGIDATTYKGKIRVLKEFIGIDLRPFFKFIEGCISNTFDVLLLSDDLEPIREESAGGNGDNGGRPAAGGNGGSKGDGKPGGNGGSKGDGKPGGNGGSKGDGKSGGNGGSKGDGKPGGNGGSEDNVSGMDTTGSSMAIEVVRGVSPQRSMLSSPAASSFQSIHPDSASDQGSAEKMSSLSMTTATAAAEESMEQEEEEEAADPVNPIGEFFRQALPPHLLEFVDTAPIEQMPPPADEEVKNGWAEIFKHVLAFNPNLLKYE